MTDETVLPPPRPRSTASPVNYVTRLMCAAAHLDGTFANHAARMLTRESYEAVAPVHGVDVVTLAHHVATARARRRQRDRHLSWVMLVMVTGYVAWLALSWLVGIDTAWFVAVPVLHVALCAGVAWWIVWQHYDEVFRHAKAVTVAGVDPLAQLDSMYDNPPRQPQLQTLLTTLPRARDFPGAQSPLGRMQALAHANVVVYAGDDPFVDGGQHVDLIKQRIDVRDAVAAVPWATSDERSAALVKDLHEELLQAVDGSGSVTAVTSRAHIWGGIAADVDAEVAGALEPDVEAGLIPADDIYHRPRSRVSDALVEHCLLSPGEWTRTYLCITQELRGGQIMVSHYVRLDVENGELLVELVSRVMPPLVSGFHNVEASLGSRRRERWRMLGHSAAMTPALLVTAPRRRWLVVIDPYVQWRRRVDFWRMWRTGRPINYGVNASLRSTAATSLDALAHYQWVDTRRAVDGIQVHVLDTLVHLLEARKVDVGRLEADVERIRRERSVSVNRTDGSVLDLGRDDLAPTR